MISNHKDEHAIEEPSPAVVAGDGNGRKPKLGSKNPNPHPRNDNSDDLSSQDVGGKVATSSPEGIVSTFSKKCATDGTSLSTENGTGKLAPMLEADAGLVRSIHEIKIHPSQADEMDWDDEALLPRIDAAPRLDREGKFLGYQRVPIEKIVEDHEDLRLRDHYDHGTLDTMENKIRYERADLPMIVIFVVTGIFYLADGVYRLLAHKRAKQTHIWAEIRIGTIRDAVLFRFRANAAHGTSLTPRERCEIVKRMYADEEWKTWSWNFVANFCGLTDKAVKAIWKKTFPSSVTPKMKTCVRNGKIYQIDTTNIGKRKAKQALPAQAAPRHSSPTRVTEDPDDLNPSEQEVNDVIEQLESLHDDVEILQAPDSDAEDAVDETALEAARMHRAAQAQSRQQVQRGEIFLFESLKNPGQYHILGCLDATDERIYVILFRFFLAGLLLLDLPYNRNYQSKVAKGEDQHELNTIDNDNLSRSAYRKLVRKVLTNSRKILAPGSAYFVFFGLHEIVPTVLLLQGIMATPIRKLIVWVKRSLKQNWSPEFREGHECAFFGHIGKSIRYWAGTKSQTTVFDEKLFDRSSNALPPKTHPCPKPVPIISAFIELTLEWGGRLFDPMAGSGTSLICAELTGRLATVIEIRPAFVAVAKEWAESIGLRCIRTTLEELPSVLSGLIVPAGTDAAVDDLTTDEN